MVAVRLRSVGEFPLYIFMPHVRWRRSLPFPPREHKMCQIKWQFVFAHWRDGRKALEWKDEMGFIFIRVSTWI